MLEDKFISIGKITKAIGLKGYVKVLNLTDFPERFKSLESIKLFNEKENLILINKFSDSENFYIKDVIYDKDSVKILLDDYDDINSVKNLIGCFLIIEESKRKKLDKGLFYYYDLIGLDVKYKDEKVGKVLSVENYGGQDLFKIKLTDANKDVLIPFVDEFIKKIDIENKFIEIEVIDGMLN
ncbi:MAG: ribosome maturation factor RimM [Ignavibacteriae bacterium]|nr:ribosome maturation factor RimM [Ignavibacteriota bacterium]